MSSRDSRERFIRILVGKMRVPVKQLLDGRLCPLMSRIARELPVDSRVARVLRDMVVAKLMKQGFRKAGGFRGAICYGK